MTTEKFCTRCGKKFVAVGREVICPSCKAQAAEETKRAAVLKAKRASWNGESVPVRISGRASTVIRAYGKHNGLPFAQALDALLQSTACFADMQMAWEDITPYKSHRRDRHATETENTSTTETAQDVTQNVQAAGKPQEVKTAARKASKPQEVKQAAKTTSKQATGKAAKTSTSKGGKKTC